MNTKNRRVVPLESGSMSEKLLSVDCWSGRPGIGIGKVFSVHNINCWPGRPLVFTLELQKCSCKFSRNLAAACICSGNLKGEGLSHSNPSIRGISTIYSLWREDSDFASGCHSILATLTVIFSSKRSSYSDDTPGPFRRQPLFEILGIYANIHT